MKARILSLILAVVMLGVLCGYAAASGDVTEATSAASEEVQTAPAPVEDATKGPEPSDVPEETDLLRGTCGDSLNFTLSNDAVLTITGNGKMYDYTNVPSRVPWYDYRGSIREVIILGAGGRYTGVTHIGDNTFSGCTALTNVSIGNTVTSIGTGAFQKCGMESITIPASVTSIGAQAFYGCANLRSIAFTGNAPTIASNAFSGLTVTCTYPDGDPTWTQDKCQQYGGTVTWPAVPTTTPAPTPTQGPATTPAPSKQGFVEENGKTYYYVDGVKQMTGLTTVGDKSYYFSVKDGHMMKSGLVNGGGGSYYYVAKDGHVMKGGWARGPQNRYYYCTDTGSVLLDQIFTAKDGQIYCVDSKGVRQYGFVLKYGKLYYFHPENSGAAVTGQSFTVTADDQGAISIDY